MSNYYNDMQSAFQAASKKIKFPKKLKMYILVKEDVPIGLAMAAVAHAAVACFDEYVNEPEMDVWFRKSFKKVVCKVTDGEFKKAKTIDYRVIMTESALNGQETAIAFCPREEWPKCFKFLRLYK